MMFEFSWKLILSSLTESLSKLPRASIVDTPTGGTRRVLALRVTRVFLWRSEGSDLHHFCIVEANSAHVLPSEVDFNLRILQRTVYVSQVVFDMLILQRDVMVLGRCAHDPLVPHRHTIFLTRTGREFTNNCGKDGVGVPVDNRGEIDVHVEDE